MPGSTEPTAAIRRVILTPGIAAVAFTVLVLLLLGQAVHLMVLLFIAVLIAVYLAAFTDAAMARTGWSRPWAFAAAIIATLLALWGLEALLVPPVIEQTRALVAGLPGYITAWQDWLGRLVVQFPALEPLVGGDRQREVVDTIISQTESMVGGIFPRVFDFAHSIVNVVSVSVMAIYMARTPKLYTDLIVSLTPPRHREVACDVLRACGVTLRHWVFAQLFNMAVLGALTTIGLLALDVPYWLAFGIFAGLAAIVPFFGTLVSTVLPALFVLDRGATAIVLVTLLGVVVHVIEGNVVAPMVFQRGVNLPPVLTIMAVLVVGSLVGPIGLVVAVPLLAVLLVLVRRILQVQIYGDPLVPVLADAPSPSPTRSTEAAGGGS
ncbi:MAG: AI-2E family transporter [Gemmatimonadetes bacterium]|nr:AI-2E family transporter [Gemmatimonadota bacterium]